MSGEDTWPFVDDGGETGSPEVSAPSPAPVVPRPGAVAARMAPPPSEAAIRGRATELWLEAANPLTSEPRRKAALAERDSLYHQLVGADEIVAQLGPQDAEPADVALPPLPSGTSWDARAVTELHAIAADAGVSSSLVRQAVNIVASVVAEPMPSEDECAATLKQEWGTGFDAKLRAARSVLDWLPEKVADQVEQLGNHPEVVMMLAEIGERVQSRPMTDKMLARKLAPYRQRLGEANEVLFTLG